MTLTYDSSSAATTCDEEVVARATALVPLLRDNAERTERDGRPPARVIDAVAQAGLFDMTKPAVRGGLEASARTAAGAIAELARGCSSTGWIVAVMTIEQWAISLLPQEGQELIYGSSRGTRTCGTFAPTAKVEKVDGGYVVTGTWAYASGSLHADWIFAGIRVPGPDGQLESAQALIPLDDSNVRIDMTWQVAGLQGTGSNTVVVTDAFVPAALVMTPARAAAGEYPSPYPGALYRSPFFAFSNLIQCAPLVGMAQAVLELTLGRARDPKRALPNTRYAARDAPVIHQSVAEGATRIDTAALHLARMAEAIDRSASGAAPPFDAEASARSRQNVGWITRQCREAVDALMDAQGSSGFMRSNPAQRFWRDCNVAARHAILDPRINQEILGRQLLGVSQYTEFI